MNQLCRLTYVISIMGENRCKIKVHIKGSNIHYFYNERMGLTSYENLATIYYYEKAKVKMDEVKKLYPENKDVHLVGHY